MEYQLVESMLVNIGFCDISFLASGNERVSSIIDALGVEIDGEYVGWQVEGPTPLESPKYSSAEPIL